MLIFDLLALIEAHGGKIDHRVRIQKEAYLLHWARFPIFHGARFKFHTLGPSSRELSDALHQAVNAGYLAEHVIRDPGNTEVVVTHHYELTSKATQERGALQMAVDPAKEYIARLNEAPRAALELAALAVFLQEDLQNSLTAPVSQREGRPPHRCGIVLLPCARRLQHFLESLKDWFPIFFF